MSTSRGMILLKIEGTFVTPIAKVVAIKTFSGRDIGPWAMVRLHQAPNKLAADK